MVPRTVASQFAGYVSLLTTAQFVLADWAFLFRPTAPVVVRAAGYGSPYHGTLLCDSSLGMVTVPPRLTD